MTRKSLKIFVQILLLGLLLGTSSSAYADAVSFASLDFSDLQITPALGTIQFDSWHSTANSVAMNSLGQSNAENDSNIQGEVAQADASVLFADASGIAIPNELSVNGITLVQVVGCTCSATAVQRAALSNTFMIVGGTGNVDVTISGLLMTMQDVMTDQFGVMAESEVIFTLAINGTPVFSHDRTLSIGRNSMDSATLSEQLSKIITLQFNTQYAIAFGLGVRSSGANEIPEPATVILLVSGLGFMGGFRKKRRNGV